ncbi:MAG: hypothetical protein KGY38_00365 [Desulfobacterales bacterium]|nr:hypothetical protein [Desulfobacterales bacterium]
MSAPENPKVSQNMDIEEERMKSLRRVVDECARELSEQDLSRQQAEARIEKTREQVLELFPGKGEQFELIYRPRFERIIQDK